MEAKVTGNKVVLSFDITPAESAPLSKSGKSKLLFSTGGFTTVAGLKLNLTVITAK